MVGVLLCQGGGGAGVMAKENGGLGESGRLLVDNGSPGELYSCTLQAINKYSKISLEKWGGV